MKVVERIGQFTWQNVGFYPWLRIVGLNVAFDQLRKRRRETLFEPNDLSTEIDRSARHDLSPSALDQYDQKENRNHVDALLAELNPRYAQVIRLRILEERSRESAALELGVSVGTLDVVLHRAMAALKKALAARGARES
jgi:RNA polymerase sigma-70 factor (ECF subfamily)